MSTRSSSRRGRWRSSDDAAPAKNRHRRAELVDLLELVRYEQNRQSLTRPTGRRAAKSSRLWLTVIPEVGSSRISTLIPAAEQPDDLELLPLSDRQASGDRRRIQSEAKAPAGLDQFGARLGHRAPASQTEVLGRRERKADKRLLVKHPDSGRQRLLRGTRARSALPSRITEPLSGETIPERIFINVDLPAPFSPRMECRVPAGSSRFIPSLATRLPNRLVMSETRSVMM